MTSINWGRVVAGGLLAGLVINVGETVLNAVFLGEDYGVAMTAYGVTESPNSVAIFTVYGFLLGILLVGVYAGMRPRFGAGPKTAIIAGLAVWFVYSGGFANFHLAIPLFPAKVAWGNLAWGLVEVPLAALAGAALYREAGDGVQA